MQLNFTDSRKGCPYGFYQMKMHVEYSLPLTRKVARRRRDGRRESNKYQTFVISPSVIFCFKKMTAPSSEGAYVCA